MEYLSMREAREYLGISRAKMRRLVKASNLSFYHDPLDHRKHLVRQEDVEKLKQPKPI